MNLRFKKIFNSKKIKKCVYIIVYWEGGHVRERIQKICDSYFWLKIWATKILDGNCIVDCKNQKFNNGMPEMSLSKLDKLSSISLHSFNRINSQNQKKTSTLYIYKMFMAKEKALF